MGRMQTLSCLQTLWRFRTSSRSAGHPLDNAGLISRTDVQSGSMRAMGGTLRDLHLALSFGPRGAVGRRSSYGRVALWSEEEVLMVGITVTIFLPLMIFLFVPFSSDSGRPLLLEIALLHDSS